MFRLIGLLGWVPKICAMFKEREVLKSQKKRYFQINGIARMPWLPAPHQEGLLFSGKMLLGWGVAVSEASELLFEHIKKLNAQQRTDVPACLIYAPISNLPVTTKHSLFSPPPLHNSIF